MEILDGASTLNLAQQIVKLVYSDEYKCQYDPNAKSFTNPRGLENWIKSDELKRLLGINHPLVTAYMRQIDTPACNFVFMSLITLAQRIFKNTPLLGYWIFMETCAGRYWNYTK